MTTCRCWKAHAWPVTLQQCEWARKHGSKLRLTQDGKEVLEEGDMSLWRSGVRGILFDERFDELNRIPNIRGQTGKAKRYFTDPHDKFVLACRGRG